MFKIVSDVFSPELLDDRYEIYDVLFRSGVMITDNDPLRQHPNEELQFLTNLEVTKTLSALKTRGYVAEHPYRRHTYWRLRAEGKEYLRGFLETELNMANQKLLQTSKKDNPYTLGLRDGQEFRMQIKEKHLTK